MSLLKKAVAEKVDKKVCWFNRLPKDKQAVLLKERTAYFREGCPCPMSSLWRVAVKELQLHVTQQAFCEWLKLGRPE